MSRPFDASGSNVASVRRSGSNVASVRRSDGHPDQARRWCAFRRGDRLGDRRVHQRASCRRADVGAADGDLPARHDGPGDRPLDGRHGGLGRADGFHRSASGREAAGVGGQALHRRGRRQDHHPAGARRDGVRGRGAASGGTRPRAHRWHAGQAGSHPGFHRRNLETPNPSTTLRPRRGDLRGRRVGACRPQDLRTA